MFSEFMPNYATVLVPVLDQFVAAYRGQIDHRFWQSMCKNVQHGFGSGSYSTVSGWINLFYPFLQQKANMTLQPWQLMEQSDGPEPDDFPLVVSSVPVEWNYHGAKLLLHFHAGMFGMAQDSNTLALSPVVGWVVSHDPPQEPAVRIKAVEKEIDDIKRSDSGNDYRTLYWLKRLQDELKRLQKK